MVDDHPQAHPLAAFTKPGSSSSAHLLSLLAGVCQGRVGKAELKLLAEASKKQKVHKHINLINLTTVDRNEVSDSGAIRT